MGEEKRRYARLKSKIRVTYFFGITKIYEEVFTEDISEDGIKITTPKRMELEQKINVKIEFVYDSVPIMAVCKVVHLKAADDQYALGLEFVEIDEFDRQRLKRCLKKLSQDMKDEL